MYGNPADPSAQLLAGWLSSRLDLYVPVEQDDGRYITKVRIEFDDGHYIEMRNESYKLVMNRPNQMDSIAPFPSRSTGDLLAEELRRLDVDESYAEALGAVSGEEDPQLAAVRAHPRLARPGTGPGCLVRPPSRSSCRRRTNSPPTSPLASWPTVSAAIEARGRAAIALTAGSIMEKVWSALASSATELDWASVDVFLGRRAFRPLSLGRPQRRACGEAPVRHRSVLGRDAVLDAALRRRVRRGPGCRGRRLRADARRARCRRHRSGAPGDRTGRALLLAVPGSPLGAGPVRHRHRSA